MKKVKCIHITESWGQKGEKGKKDEQSVGGEKEGCGHRQMRFSRKCGE